MSPGQAWSTANELHWLRGLTEDQFYQQVYIIMRGLRNYGPPVDLIKLRRSIRGLITERRARALPPDTFAPPHRPETNDPRSAICLHAF